MSTSSPGPPRRTSSPSPPISTAAPAPPFGSELDRSGREGGSVDHVVAGEQVDREPVVGALCADDVRLRGQTGDGDACGIPGHHGDVVAIGALDHDVVGLGVAAATEGCKVSVHLG
jgi:hypothetical protein